MGSRTLIARMLPRKSKAVRGTFLALVVAAWLVTPGSAAGYTCTPGPPGTTTCVFQGNGSDLFIAPDGVTELFVQAWGGPGHKGGRARARSLEFCQLRAYAHSRCRVWMKRSAFPFHRGV